LNYFPAVNSGSGFTGAAADGFAPAAVGGKFVDVIGPDLYAFGGGGLSYPDEVDPTSLTTTTAWFFDSCVKIAQSQGLTFGISEFGDFSGQTEATARAWDPTYSQGGRTGGWTPNHFFNYMNNLKNLSPAVPIEFICIYDVNVAPLLIPFSNMSQTNSDLMGYRKILGLGGTAPTPIMTIAVP
jgi:hypothetical protein